MQHIPSGYPEPHDNAPSLANWTGRLALQLRDLLDPTFRNLDTDPTEQLTSSLDDKPNWTLLALVRLAKDSQESSVSCRWNSVTQEPNYVVELSLACNAG